MSFPLQHVTYHWSIVSHIDTQLFLIVLSRQNMNKQGLHHFVHLTKGLQGLKKDNASVFICGTLQLTYGIRNVR